METAVRSRTAWKPAMREGWPIRSTWISPPYPSSLLRDDAEQIAAWEALVIRSRVRQHQGVSDDAGENGVGDGLCLISRIGAQRAGEHRVPPASHVADGVGPGFDEYRLDP